MPILLTELLRDLREDHRNMSILLDILDHEMNRIRAGDEPDLELMQDIMRYLTVHADAVHHPKEDILYAALRSERPDIAAGLDRVGHEHAQLADRGQALRDDVDAAASGTAVTRERLLDDSRAYAATLRKHMAWEEEDLFRRARDIVSDNASMSVDVAEVHAVDPVFSAQRNHAFENLLLHIKKMGTVTN